MTLADLQSNISISANNAVTGDIEFCTGYTGFSDNIGEQAGWYLALKVSTSAEGSALEGATITATYAGTVRTLEDGETFIVRLAEGEDSITFTANKEGYTEGRLTLDISGLDKEALTQNILYTASLTNGVTVSPLQFGESKTITGQVPWNTTDNANTFNISMRPFEMVAPGTPWSIAFNGIEIAEGEFSTITPASGSPYSFAGAKLPITQEMISDQSPYLVVTVRSYGPDPMGSFYSSMNIGGLTLAPDPRTKMNITTDIAGVTITPSTYSSTKTATGVVPYTNYYRLQLYPTITNAPVADLYTIMVYDKDNNVAVNLSGMTELTSISTNGIAIDMSYSPSYMGTGAFFKIVLGSKATADAYYTTLDTVILDVSALTLGPDPSAIGMKLIYENPSIILSTNDYVYPGQTLYITGTIPNSVPRAEMLLTHPIPSGDTWNAQRQIPAGTYSTLGAMSNTGEGTDLHAHLSSKAVYLPSHAQQSGVLFRVIDQNTDNEITSINIDATGATYEPYSMLMETAGANDVVGVQDSGDSSELNLKASDFGNITVTLDTSGSDPWTSFSRNTVNTYKFNISGTVNSTPTGATNGHTITTSSTNGILFYITDVSSSASDLTTATVGSFAYDQRAYFIPVKFFANMATKGNRLTTPTQAVTSPGFFILMIPKATFDAASTRTVKIKMKNDSSGSGYCTYQLNLTNVTVTT